MPKKLEEVMNIMNLVFTIYFVVEFLIRITGMGPDLYFSTKMNWWVWCSTDICGVCVLSSVSIRNSAACQ